MGIETVVDFSVQSSEAPNSDTDNDWLLVGKLAPPQQRVTAARRVSLLARLNDALPLALSVVVSPPGFGKTTLLTQWWQDLQKRNDVAACWLSLDEVDTEASRLLAGLILTVAGAGVDVGPLEIAARQQSIDASIRPIVAALLLAIRKNQRRVVVILDDYHRARSSAVDQVIETLVEHGRDALHVVVSGRNKPTFRVSALAARGLVNFLDAADLALSEAEASEIVGPDVSTADLAVLHARTEGWAVALQLARLWLERGHRTPDGLREFSGRTIEMTDYLAEQIVQDLPVELRDFLLEVSLLERFNPDLANAVRGASDSAELLERLAPFDALLVPLDSNRDWYRFHTLFADFLAQRLHRGPPGRVATLHRNAARWLACAGDLIEAVRHALKADDVPLAVELADAAGGWELVLWRGIGHVRSLLNCFSEATIRAEPVLQLTQAYIHLKLAQYDAARDILALTETLLESTTEKIQRDFKVLSSLRRVYIDDLAQADLAAALESQVQCLGATDHLRRGTLLAAVAVAAIAFGDVDRTDNASRRAIQAMRAAGSILGTNYCFLHLAQSQMMRGKLREAESLFREAAVMAEDNFGADSGLKALSGSFLSYCLYLRNDLKGSSDFLDSSLESIETADGWLDVFAVAYDVAVARAFRTGGINAAMQMIDRAVTTARKRKLERLTTMAAAWRVEYLAATGHANDARREAQASGVIAAAEQRGTLTFSWRTRYAATSAIARLWIVTGASAQALTLLDSVSHDFRTAGLSLPAHRLGAHAVIALRQRRSESEAVQRLESLLEFVVNEGATRILLEQGIALEPLLHIAHRRSHAMVLSGAQRDVIAHLLAELRREHPRSQDGFSSRELEVLRELCNGHSNKVIGQLLDLSENTVKFHLKRVFKKLDVESRAAAIAAARQRGLMESPDPKKRRSDQRFT